MTIEEYKTELSALTDKYNKEKKEIQINYALSNSFVKIGDIVTDRNGSILVKRIGWYYSTAKNIPSCVYVGQPLKKDGTETKKKELRSIYQVDIQD